MAEKSSTLITVKIVIPADSRGMFQTHLLSIRDPSWDTFRGKVREITQQKQTAVYRLFWWNVDRYYEITNDRSFCDTIQQWFDGSVTNPSVYVTFGHHEPDKVYGSVPYDVLPMSSDSMRAKRRTLSALALRHHKSKAHRVMTEYSSRPVQSKINYIQPGMLAYPDSPVNYASNAVGSEPMVSEIHRSGIGATSHPVEQNTHSTALACQPSSIAQEHVMDQEAEDEDILQSAIETLRNMGFEQSEETLRYCIIQSKGDLNAIIDWLQAQEFSQLSS